MSRPDSNPDPKKSQQKENFWVQAARYSELAMVFPAAVVVGWLVGVALDHWLHTSWLYLAGLLVGGAAGFVELVRVAMQDTDSE